MSEPTLTREPRPRCKTVDCFGVDDKSCSDACIMRHHGELSVLRKQLAAMTKEREECLVLWKLEKETVEMLTQERDNLKGCLAVSSTSSEKELLSKLATVTQERDHYRDEYICHSLGNNSSAYQDLQKKVERLEGERDKWISDCIDAERQLAEVTERERQAQFDRALLTKTNQDLESQRAATYQAVEREHKAKAELAEMTERLRLAQMAIAKGLMDTGPNHRRDTPHEA